jgi:hypothetical protein
LQCVLAAKILTVDFVVCTLAVKKKSGQVSTCRIGPFPCETQSLTASVQSFHLIRAMIYKTEKYLLSKTSSKVCHYQRVIYVITLSLECY